MKTKTWLWIIALCVLLIIFSVIFSGDSSKDSSNFEEAKITGGMIDSSQEIIEEEPIEVKEEIEEAEIVEEIIHTKEYYLVTRVIDGDTIEIETEERIRLICIDSPEAGNEGYKEAKDYLESLILDKKVKLETDVSDKDKYDRLLRYIYLENGDFVNEMIVLSGYAEAYPYAPDTKLCPIIQDAEEIAKDKKIGMWYVEEVIEVEEIPPITFSYDCSSNVYNCGDFDSYSEALEVFNYCGGASNDVHRLDGDSDGIPCESLRG